MESLDGEAEIVKSSNSTVSGSVAITVPVLDPSVAPVPVGGLELPDGATVPVTEKFSDMEVTWPRLPTVSVLDPPGESVAGSNEQVAGAMFSQPRTMGVTVPRLTEAVNVNCAYSAPSRTLTEVCCAVSVTEMVPVPDRLTV